MNLSSRISLQGIRAAAQSATKMERAGWTFLSNHSHVLIALAKNPELRIRDLAGEVGITERAVAQILNDLEEAKVLMRDREGRRNVYTINAKAPLRHRVEAHRTVADLLRLAEQIESFDAARRARR